MLDWAILGEQVIVRLSGSLQGLLLSAVDRIGVILIDPVPISREPNQIPFSIFNFDSGDTGRYRLDCHVRTSLRFLKRKKPGVPLLKSTRH